jgi:hypothetical protein
MPLKSITAIVEQKDIETVKDVYENLKEKLTNFKPTPLKYGKLGDKFLVTFKVESESFNFAIEKLTYNRIKIFSLEKKDSEVIEEIQTQISNRAKNQPYKDVNWDDLKDSQGHGSGKIKMKLETDIKNGDYRKVIAVSRNIKHTKDVLEKAKNSIPIALTNAITIEKNRSESSRYGKELAIKNLMHISTDAKLKSINMSNHLKQAGLLMVDLCASEKRFFDELINICNNSSLHNVVNITAAIKFYETTGFNDETFEELIKEAVKKINIRWLQNAFDIAQNEFNSLQIDEFDKFVDEITKRRSL